MQKVTRRSGIIQYSKSHYEYYRSLTCRSYTLLYTVLFQQIIKSRISNLDGLTKFVRENHPYEVCEVISTPVMTFFAFNTPVAPFTTRVDCIYYKTPFTFLFPISRCSVIFLVTCHSVDYARQSSLLGMAPRRNGRAHSQSALHGRRRVNAAFTPNYHTFLHKFVLIAYTNRLPHTRTQLLSRNKSSK